MKAHYFALLVVLCFGCQSVVKTAYGVKKPKLETENSIKRYLVKHKVDTTNVYVFKDFQSFAKASEKNILSFPEAFFFNGKGNLVRYKKETESCNAKVFDFLSDLKDFSKMEEDPSFTMDDYFELLNSKPTDAKADVNVIITWATYAGRINKTKAFEWINLIEKARANGIKANWYLLNCDYQKSWNLPKIALDKLGIKD